MTVIFTTLKKGKEGFPGGAVVGGPPADAGDAGSSPGLGGSHMLWSGWARAPRLLSLCSRAHAATGEKPARSNEDPTQPKINKLNK